MDNTRSSRPYFSIQLAATSKKKKELSNLLTVLKQGNGR